MKRKELARELTKTTHTPPAAAQDRVDEVVHEILRRLRAGEPVDLEGLGLKGPAVKRMSARPASSK
ncbi:MAG: HU family DNA-binding protein [Bryobacteraceae bacterium]